jgi:hypothetical protein
LQNQSKILQGRACTNRPAHHERLQAKIVVHRDLDILLRPLSTATQTPRAGQFSYWTFSGYSAQQREEHWAIDLLGKAGHVRTVPIPTGPSGKNAEHHQCHIVVITGPPVSKRKTWLLLSELFVVVFQNYLS